MCVVDRRCCRRCRGSWVSCRSWTACRGREPPRSSTCCCETSVTSAPSSAPATSRPLWWGQTHTYTVCTHAHYLPHSHPNTPLHLSVLRDEGERLGSGGGVHCRSPLHQQDEVWGQVIGQPQQAAGERSGWRPPQDPGQWEGAGILSAAHLPGNRHHGHHGSLIVTLQWAVGAALSFLLLKF